MRDTNRREQRTLENVESIEGLSGRGGGVRRERRRIQDSLGNSQDLLGSGESGLVTLLHEFEDELTAKNDELLGSAPDFGGENRESSAGEDGLLEQDETGDFLARALNKNGTGRFKSLNFQLEFRGSCLRDDNN